MNEIIIYGDIGESIWGESVRAVDVQKNLASMQGDVTVRINSPGGSVFDGFAIYSLLKAHQGDVTIHVDGLAASAASVIAMAGDTIVMGETAIMMIHNPWTMAVGDAEEMIKTAQALEKIKDSIVIAYQSKAEGLSVEEISAMMDDETWMSADEAITMGFASSLTESYAVANSVERPWINKAPEPKADLSGIVLRRKYTIF
jgi:ATP-dependent Clp endopeptidase proteolytic subunit ClpP